MKLPGVFANPVDKEFRNVQKEYRGIIRNEANDDKEPLMVKINKIFSSKDFVYKARVMIKTINGNEEKVIVGKTNNALLTMSGERIKINDIYDIKKIY